MNQRPPRQQDPLALAIFGAALALLAGLLLYVFVFKTPELAAPARAFDIVGEIRRQIAGLAAGLEDKPAAPRPPASATPPSAAWLPVGQVQAGITWTYKVSVEPPVWQDAVLVYRTVQQGDALVVHTEFRHAKGEMKFQLGTFQRGHPSHANTRFPGFFMHPAYFADRLQVGQKLAWEWPWQLPGGGIKSGRIKRYEGEVVGFEDNPGPVFPFTTAARIETRLTYIEDGRVQAAARETLWYSAKAQLIKVVREGRTPDEGSSRIVAELAEYR